MGQAHAIANREFTSVFGLTRGLDRRELSLMKANGVRQVRGGGLVLAAALFGCCTFAPDGRAQSRQSPLVGKPAPSFHLQGVYGETYSLDKFKGHILVMQFGSSW